jgi:hypothetical protein
MDGTLFSLVFVLVVIAGIIWVTNFQKEKIRKSAQQKGWIILDISWGGPGFGFPGKRINSQGFKVEYEDEKGFVNERGCEVLFLGDVRWEEKD